MKAYESYKETDKEWIGHVPIHWTPIPVKYYFYMKGRIGWQGLKSDEFKEEGPFLVTGTDFENGKVIWDRCYHITEERFAEDPAIHVKEHDLLVTKDGTVGKLAYIDEKPEKVSLNSHLLILRPYNQSIIYNKFIYWYLMSKVFRTYIGLKQTGSIMESLSQEKIGDFWIGLPPIDEQKAIADFLDAKISDLDNETKNILYQIDLLKELKASVISRVVSRGLSEKREFTKSRLFGIEFPSNWSIKQLKFALSGLQDGTHGTFERLTEGPLLLSAKNISENGVEIGELEAHISEDDYKEIISNGFPKKGDIAICCVGTIGRCCLYELEQPLAFQRSVTFLRPNHNHFAKFLLYVLRSNLVSSQLEKNKKTATISGIYMGDIAQLLIPIPPLDEQKQIATYLDSQTVKIDEQIKLLEKQIKLIDELKQSIISQAVTGKIKVI